MDVETLLRVAEPRALSGALPDRLSISTRGVVLRLDGAEDDSFFNEARSDDITPAYEAQLHSVSEAG